MNLEELHQYLKAKVDAIMAERDSKPYDHNGQATVWVEYLPGIRVDVCYESPGGGDLGFVSYAPSMLEYDPKILSISSVEHGIHNHDKHRANGLSLQALVILSVKAHRPDALGVYHIEI